MRRTVASLVLSSFFFVACSNPRSVTVTEQNRDDVLKKVGASGRLSDDDKKALLAYVTRVEIVGKGGTLGQAIARQGSSDVLPSFGKTVGQMIDEQNKYQAELRAEDEKEKRLASEAKARADALATELRKTVSLTVFDKSFLPSDYQAGRVYDFIVIKCAYRNSSAKNVRAFKGTIHFTDLFGAEILSSGVTISDPIAAGQEATWMGTIQYNQFMAPHTRLRNTELKDMRVVWKPSAIIFEDGSQIGDTTGASS